MPKTLKPRKPDVCRLLVEIRGIRYYARPSPAPAGLRAWKLTREDRAAAYIVAESRDGPRCSCPDDRYRHRGMCKHTLAAVALGLVAG